MSKIKERCPDCDCNTRAIKMRAYSAKFNAYFCNQSCYESHRKKLDEHWNDKPISVINGKKDKESV